MIAPLITQTQELEKSEKLEKYFLELDHFYLTLQNDRGDRLLDNIKKAYKLTYSELNDLYLQHKQQKQKLL